jgi:hypothetical protein
MQFQEAHVALFPQAAPRVKQTPLKCKSTAGSGIYPAKNHTADDPAVAAPLLRVSVGRGAAIWKNWTSLSQNLTKTIGMSFRKP